MFLRKKKPYYQNQFHLSFLGIKIKFFYVTEKIVNKEWGTERVRIKSYITSYKLKWLFVKTISSYSENKLYWR